MYQEIKIKADFVRKIWLCFYTSVLRIHGNFVRIRIRGSMPLTNGSGFRSCFFRQWPTRRQQKTNLKKLFFCLLLFEGTFTSFFKVKKVKKKSQNSRNQGFSYYCCLMVEGSGSVPLTNGSGSRRPKNIRIRRIRIRNTAIHTSKMVRFWTPLMLGTSSPWEVSMATPILWLNL